MWFQAWKRMKTTDVMVLYMYSHGIVLIIRFRVWNCMETSLFRIQEELLKQTFLHEVTINLEKSF